MNCIRVQYDDELYVFCYALNNVCRKFTANQIKMIFTLKKNINRRSQVKWNIFGILRFLPFFFFRRSKMCRICIKFWSFWQFSSLKKMDSQLEVKMKKKHAHIFANLSTNKFVPKYYRNFLQPFQFHWPKWNMLATAKWKEWLWLSIFPTFPHWIS